jgi:hypothetical protein
LALAANVLSAGFVRPLNVLAYNMKRVMAIVGVRALVEAARA